MRVALVGGGLSGTLTAANLVRRAGDAVRVTLLERRGDFGPGVAYSTTDEQHRLNVPAARMSAFSDDPDHFLRWARRTLGDVDAAAYLPRARYGDERYARLVAVKDRYDPDNVFRLNQNIKPSASARG